ncbi:DUF2786 domain-containing protein [Nocardioides limicola]|uniref:DUF2786 domain-containing protein n=1 Tax=Nocardioides limicola TaxID=2803368 RepID=UPI00193B32F4|nr:DUF2786 domain-containing protein [Nocardioides sp. DJM-14]
MNDADPVLAKVRKLLAKAEDPAATPAEAEIYTAKATQLIAQHGLADALREAATDGSAVVDRQVRLDPPYAVDKADLLGVVAYRLGCRAVRLTDRRGGAKEVTLHVFGHRSDLDRVELLFTSLLLQAVRDLARTPVPRRQHAAAYRRSWLAGFTGAVSQRLRAAEERASAAAEADFRQAGLSTALVLADRSAEVGRALETAYPTVSHARPRHLSGDGGHAGWAAGHRADLGDGRLDRRRADQLR